MHYSPIEIGDRIHDLRKKRKLTQEQLSEKLEISTVYLSLIENGTRKCSLDLIIRIATFFDVSLDYLVMGKLAGRDISCELSAVIATLTKLQKDL